ncbi:hypothetical protein QIT38_gp15 [Methanocaldococcus fervens tailed virus 1]|uniref:Uncharacterized protein n=2 Tax=root TaxID=1 RepID=C7P5H7_METFA|nr:hypothetical protein [Methanocaldococcus fervens]YP_010772310.1 hypothetical protein QIT38_gp15 [Methanocaldococcus fervens tailed virus 1]ACV25355.1 hypothetical protein Mefer_1552 [Methanocaldococcus fervens AG86]QNO11485.1 hypothetical protein [Methanocaldococcus fervens tailed virus 1]
MKKRGRCSLTNYTNAKALVEEIINKLKESGVKVKSPLSKIQDFHCEADFSIEIENRVAYVDATFTFDKPPNSNMVEKIEAVMTTYNSYLERIDFEADYTKLEFRSVR